MMKSTGLVQFLASAAALLLACTSCSKEEKQRAPSNPSSSTTGSQAESVQVGAKAPLFSAIAHSGEKVQLEKLQGKTVVLYFYPKDNTPGCTVEAQGFRDSYQTYEDRDVVVIGVSTQDNESHRQFAEEHGLPFLLIPDEDRSIAESYGVGSMLGMSKRMTFLIGPDGKIAKIYEDVVPKKHAAQLLADIDALKL